MGSLLKVLLAIMAIVVVLGIAFYGVVLLTAWI